MNNKRVKTRFAPSPTGYLHIGGVRTALYSWLYAKKHQGEFVLRIEDTDQARSTEESVNTILDGMKWLKLIPDGAPVYQSHRFEHYLTVAQTLVSSGHAYYCHCSKERLATLRETQIQNKQKPRYDGHCRDLGLDGKQEACVIRFRNPESGEASFHDAVHGEIRVQNTELDDVILIRSDNVPTYNFTVVIDDSDMQITHVIRGDDHINNTPRQNNIYLALGLTPPEYVHVPMILGEDGKRLSKRHGAVSVLHFREQGYLPDALLNYLLRLGWSHGDQEIFTRDEMIALFDIEHLHKSAASVNAEKLDWLNQQTMKNMASCDIVPELRWHFSRQEIDIEQGPALEDLIIAQRDRVKTLSEMVDKSLYFYQPINTYDEEAVTKHITVDILPVLSEFTAQLGQLDTWDKEAIHALIASIAKQHELKMGKLAQPLRIAVTGSTISPSIDLTVYLLGQTMALKRLNAFLKQMNG